MSERGCPPWCAEQHPIDAGPDKADMEIWLHRSAAALIHTRAQRSVLRSEWTSSCVGVYLARVDDPNDDTQYQTVIEVAHDGVLLTVTASEARDLASALREHADRVDDASTRLRVRRRPERRRSAG